jgi:hypothetical protein
MIQLIKTSLTVLSSSMTTSLPRYAFVCAKHNQTIVVKHGNTNKSLETDLDEEIVFLAPLAINAALKEDIHVLLIDRKSGKYVDFAGMIRGK